MTDFWQAETSGVRRLSGNAARRLALLTLLLVAAAPVVPAGPPKPACELITAQDAARALGAAVTIDRSASGPDPNGGDNCVWNAADRRNVMVRVIAVPNRDLVTFTYKGELANAFGGGKPPEVIKGLADEANYRVYGGNLSGGVVVGRKGQVVFVVEARAGRENLVDLTRALLSRL